MSYYFTIHLPKVWVISERSVARLQAAFTDHSASLIFFSVAQKPEMHIRNAAQHVDVQKCLHDRSSNMFYSNNIVSDKDKRSCRFPINHNPTTTTKNKKTKKQHTFLWSWYLLSSQVCDNLFTTKGVTLKMQQDNLW